MPRAPASTSGRVDAAVRRRAPERSFRDQIALHRAAGCRTGWPRRSGSTARSTRLIVGLGAEPPDRRLAPHGPAADPDDPELLAPPLRPDAARDASTARSSTRSSRATPRRRSAALRAHLTASRDEFLSRPPEELPTQASTPALTGRRICSSRTTNQREECHVDIAAMKAAAAPLFASALAWPARQCRAGRAEDRRRSHDADLAVLDVLRQLPRAKRPRPRASSCSRRSTPSSTPPSRSPASRT